MSDLTVYFLKGLPGSGKSTESNKILAKDENARRVNKDSIREILEQHSQSLEGIFDKKLLRDMVFGNLKQTADQHAYCAELQSHLVEDFRTQKDSFVKAKKAKNKPKEAVVLKVQTSVLKFFIAQGNNIIVDDTNYNPEHYQRVRNLCEDYSFKIIDMHRDFGVTLEQCIDRNSKRDRVVPKIAIYGMAKQWNVFPKNTDGTAVPAAAMDKPYVTDNDKVIIVDLDGTLCDTTHRNCFVDTTGNKKKQWGKFFAGMADDALRDEMKSLIDDTHPDCDVVIVTGRPDSYKKVTLDWLSQYGIRYNAIYMRRANDRRPDTVVKQEILDNYLPKEKIVMVYDDRGSVIKMWQSNGLPVTNMGGANNDF